MYAIFLMCTYTTTLALYPRAKSPTPLPPALLPPHPLLQPLLLHAPNLLLINLRRRLTDLPLPLALLARFDTDRDAFGGIVVGACTCGCGADLAFGIFPACGGVCDFVSFCCWGSVLKGWEMEDAVVKGCGWIMKRERDILV